MASQADTHTTRYHRRAHRRRRQVPMEEGGGGTTEASKPIRLSCQTASLFPDADKSHQGGVRWVGGNCRGPMASQAATRALPPLPPSARPSDVHCDASAIHMHVCCARAPPPAAAPTTSHCLPAGSTPGSRGFIVGAMDFAVVEEKRGEGRGGGLPRPHSLPGCHPHPTTSTPPPPSPPRASPLASWTPRSQPLLNR
jgi:hypothetical protein